MEILEVEVMEEKSELLTIVESSGVEKTKSQKLLDMFTPYFSKMGEIEGKIKVLNAANPTKEDVKIAREIRLALKNNRVASEKVKDDSKAAILIEGRLIDSLNNIVKNTSKGLEMQCEQIEKDAELKEAARLETLKNERIELLAPFVEDATIYPLGTIGEDAFNDLLTGSKLAYEAKIEAAKVAEEKRIAEEKAHRLEQERIKAENEKLKAEAEAKELAIQKERAEAKAKADALELENKKKLAAIEKANEDARQKAAAEQKKVQEELAKKAAELKAIEAAKEAQLQKERAEAKAKIEADKKAAKAPKKQKMKVWVAGFVMGAPAGMSDDTDVLNILAKFESFKKWAADQVDAI